MRRRAPVLLIAVLLVSGCSGQTTTPPSPTLSPTSAPTPSVTPTPTLTVAPVSPTPTSSATEPLTPPPTTPTTSEPTTPSDPIDPAKAQIIEACQTWQTSLSQDAATFPGTQSSAYSLAASSAAADAQWKPIADSMATLISLIGDNSSDGLAKGQQTFTYLSIECSGVGVTVSGG